MAKILTRVRRNDAGMTTAEYAVGTCATAGLGGILIKLLTGDNVTNLLWNVVKSAFSFLF